MCWETLKLRSNHGADPQGLDATRYTDSALAAKQARELEQLRGKLANFDGRLEDPAPISARVFVCRKT